VIGFAGAHRTGKTTLARASALALDLPFVETKVTDVFAAMGLDPAKPMDFQTRLVVQKVVLKELIEKWSGYKGAFLSDRTPIDMLAYTMAEVRGDTLNPTTERLLASYFADCIKATNDHFALVVLVQPGIKVVPAPGKASLSMGYMEHLNTLIMGALMRKDLLPLVSFIKREVLDLDGRVNRVVSAHKHLINQATQLGKRTSTRH